MNGVESKEFNELSEEFVMDSLQLCETINKYRQEEGKDKKLEHNNLMKSIKTELEALEKAGIRGEVNFYRSSYVSSQNKKLPCYALTKFGAMQIMNKESAYVRYKTQEYIEELEFRNSVLEVPYNEMAEDRLVNGFNFKESLNYLETYDIDDLVGTKPLSESFRKIGYFPYTAYVKKYFDPTNFKQMDKLINSTDFKEDGVTTLTSTEFINLLESNSVTYTSKSGRIQIEDTVVSKGKIKVISEKALVHLALTLNNSEIAKDFRQFLLDSQLIELQQVNQITNEKDIKAIYELQRQAIEMMNKLNKEKELFNKEKEDFLKDKEAFRQKEAILKDFQIESKGKTKLRDRIKKAFKILFGGDAQYSHEIVIKEIKYEQSQEETKIDNKIESVEVIEIDYEEKQEESTETIFEPYNSPIDTRGPIFTTVLGRPIPVENPGDPSKRSILSRDELKNEFNRVVHQIYREYNLDIQRIYREAYDALEIRYHISLRRDPVRGPIINRLRAPHLRYAIDYLNETYPL